MTAKEKLAAAKAGKRITTSDGKTKTTMKGGWSITTGVQKKTNAPRAKSHTPSPKSTAGRSIKYHGGKSNVVDLGHNPTKSAISTATTKLRTATKTTKPKAKKNTTSAVPELKVPQTGAPTTTPAVPTSNSAGAIVARGAAVTAVGAGVAYGVHKLMQPAPAKPKTPTVKPKQLGIGAKQLGPGYEHAKPVGKIEPVKKAKPMSQLKIPEAPKGLPKPPLGLPGPEKPTRRQIVDDLRAKSAPKVAKVKTPTASKVPTKVSVAHDARRAKQGAELKNAFGAAERADARIEADEKAAKKEIKLEAKRQQLRRHGAPADSGLTKAYFEAKAASDARKAAVPTTPRAERFPGTHKPDLARTIEVTLGSKAKAPSATAGFGATEADVAKVATSGQTTKPPTAEQKLANAKAVSEAPKEVQDLVKQVDAAKPKTSARQPSPMAVNEANVAKVTAPKVGEVPDILGGHSKIQREGTLPTPVKGVAPPKPGALVPAEAHGPEAPKAAAPQVAKVTAGGADAKASYDAAREAMRSGDAERMRAAVGKLPKGTKKTEKFTKNLEAGIQAAGNKPPPKSSTPRADAPAPEAPKIEAPKVKAPKVGAVTGVPAPVAEAPKTKSPKNLKRDLARARVTNEKLKAAAPAAVEAPAEPMRGNTPAETTAAAGNLRGVAVESVEPTAAQLDAAKGTAAKKRYYRNLKQSRRAARDAAIQEKGIMTIPEGAEAGDVEVAEVNQRKIQNQLLDATLAEGRGKTPTGPVSVGTDVDKRTAADIVGREAVESKVRVMPPGPRDLETEHGGGRQQGTIADIIDQDTEVRDARSEEIRKAAAKARTIAASRDASPTQLKALEVAVDSEYDRSLEIYFDDAPEEGPKNQRGPQKPDARTMFLDPMIEADAELAEARGAAQPPAPSDRTTLDQKIAEVKKRITAGGDSIYKGEDTLRMLENLRDNKPAEVTAPRSTSVLPPAADLPKEHFSKERGSVKRARQAGINAGEAAAKAKRLSGAAGPVDVPDMTKPGVIPAGPTTPPAEPARERGVVRGPPKTMAQLWTGRMAEWGRSAYQAQVKRLTSPMLDVAGEKAAETTKAEAKVRKAGGVVKTLGLATAAFAGLGAAEAYSKEADPKKRAGAAKEEFKTQLPEVAKGIAKFTGMDLIATVVAPAAIGMATGSAALAGGAVAAGKLGIAGLIGYHAMPFTGKKLGELAHVATEARKSASDAAAEKKASEAKYGTVEAATKTRHAKEAVKRRQKLAAKEK